jgi:hypothetical protein
MARKLFGYIGRDIISSIRKHIGQIVIRGRGGSLPFTRRMLKYFKEKVLDKSH